MLRQKFNKDPLNAAQGPGFAWDSYGLGIQPSVNKPVRDDRSDLHGIASQDMSYGRQFRGQLAHVQTVDLCTVPRLRGGFTLVKPAWRDEVYTD